VREPSAGDAAVSVAERTYEHSARHLHTSALQGGNDASNFKMSFLVSNPLETRPIDEDLNVPCPMRVRDLTKEGMEPHPGLRFMSWNPNGLNDQFRRNTFSEQLETKTCDVSDFYPGAQHKT
jgi:hypothetical protein